MPTITLPNVRIENDVRMNAALKDNGVRVDWNSLTDIYAALYADTQRVMAGPCTTEIDPEDGENLIVRYGAGQPQYLGAQRLVIRCKYQGRKKTYDVPAFVFVSQTADLENEELEISDPEVDVELEVREVSTSLLDEAIDACIAATGSANTKMAAFTLQEQTRQSNEASRVNAELARGSAENTRDRNESTRQSNEASRVNAELARGSAENTRDRNESTRQSNEAGRNQNETERQSAETLREQSFNATKQACETAAELAGEKAEAASDAADLANEKAELANTKAGIAQAAADRAEALSDHPNYIDETSYHWMKWNEESEEYEDTGIMATGSPYAEFDIDTTTGQLTIETTNLYGGPTFELNDDTGNLEITI